MSCYIDPRESGRHIITLVEELGNVTVSKERGKLHHSEAQTDAA
jgi:hypothetical protein